MKINQVTDEELELYFNFLMKNYGVTDVQEFDFMVDDNNLSCTKWQDLLEAI